MCEQLLGRESAGFKRYDLREVIQWIFTSVGFFDLSFSVHGMGLIICTSQDWGRSQSDMGSGDASVTWTLT